MKEMKIIFSRKHEATPWAACGLSVTLALVGALCATPARADDSQPSNVARISVLRGNVNLQRGDSGDTIAATVNAPVNVGDYLTTTGSDARAEVQLDGNDFVRVGENAQLRFTRLDPNQQAVQIAQGTMELRVLKYGGDPQIDTPSISVRPDVAGQYRISVDTNGDTTLTVRSGRADLLAPQRAQTIDSGVSVAITGSSSNPVISSVSTVAYDDFDSWNAERDQYTERVYNDQYVSADMVGADDLDEYGHWVYEADYGNVWIPYGVGPSWAPYHSGHWVWEPYYGWTWVAYEPWGWAPYHYGRWFWTGGYGWAWYPGPVYVRPVYRPALVAFFGFGGGGTSFSLSFGNVGWVPLAPYEPFHPWWGPTIVNRTVVYNVTNINVTNVNITRVYRNARVEGGVAVVSHANFTDGTTYHYVALHPNDIRTVSLVKGGVPVVPTKANLTVAKTEPGHVVNPSPLSPHFQRLAPVTKSPPSFETQRAAIQTATQHFSTNGALNNGSSHNGLLNTEPAHNGAAGGVLNKTTSGNSAPPSAWSRFNTTRGNHPNGGSGTTLNGAGQGSLPGGNAATHTTTMHANPTNPWTKFSPKNNSYTARSHNLRHVSSNARNHGPKPPKNPGPKKPG